ncbi:MAG: DegT/DnrJ/EryC1/StrS family aminotransferase [Phycisphaerae bacterium]
MSKLAMLGGKPVTKDILAGAKLKLRPDLERECLLREHSGGVWDDWPGRKGACHMFAAAWAKFNGAKFCSLLTSGTHALQLALEALGIGAGDEVIVPGLTWQATAAAVCDVNAVPVLVDADPLTLCIDPSAIQAAVTRRTRAIIPVHLYHRMADMDRILQIARRNSLRVVEDCAHSHGSQWDGRGAGSLGDFGAFSFQRSKPMNAGEGGCLLTSDEELYWKVESLRTCGRELSGQEPGVKVHGGSYRMTGFQAAVLLGQLEAMKANARIIDRNGRALDQAVAAAPGTRPLRRSRHITRQTGYAFAFLYNQDEYDGLSGELFRKALSAELGCQFGTTYTPLNHSELYYPQTKRRHQISREYVKAITPSRWALPVAEELWRDRAVLAFWTLYACPPDRAHLLTDGIAKVYQHRGELLRKSGARA